MLFTPRIAHQELVNVLHWHAVTLVQTSQDAEQGPQPLWITMPGNAGWSDRRLALCEPEGWWKAIVRDDGCIDLYRYHNVPLDHPHPPNCWENELHICDVDDLILRLQALKAVAQQHFPQSDA